MKFELIWRGMPYVCEWIEETNFEEFDGKINGSIGFFFDEEDKVCIVNCKEDQGWTFPGGGLEEYDKSYEETVIREADEEADIEIENVKRVGYISGYPKNEPEKKDYTLRFTGRISKVKEQSIDPATGEVPLRKFVRPDEAFNYVKWDSNGEQQLKKALEVLKDE